MSSYFGLNSKAISKHEILALALPWLISLIRGHPTALWFRAYDHLEFPFGHRTLGLLNLLSNSLFTVFYPVLCLPLVDPYAAKMPTRQGLLATQTFCVPSQCP